MRQIGDNEQASSLLNSARRIVDTLLCTVRNRVELLALEVQEEKWRAVVLLAWAAAALFFAFTAAIVVTITIVAFAPSEARPFVLLGFSVLYLFLAVLAVIGLKRQLRDRPAPLSDSIAELKKDIAWFRSRD